MTTLYVTHDQEEALVLADRIVVMNTGTIEQVGSPEDIYLHPDTRFVATFVGINNIVDGNVDEVDTANNRVRIAQSLGEPFWASASKDKVGDLSKGSPVAVSVRPEAIMVNGAANGAANPAISAKVHASAFLGNRFDLRLEIGGNEFRCQVPAMDFGETVNVSFNSELAWVID